MNKPIQTPKDKAQTGLEDFIPIGKAAEEVMRKLADKRGGK